MRFRSCAALLALASMLLQPSTVLAHATIVGKTPLPNSIVKVAPLRVAVLVGESGAGMEPDDSLSVFNAAGVNHAGLLRRVDVGENTRLEADLTGIRNGWYVAHHDFTFSDGHPSTGAGSPWWVFGVNVKSVSSPTKQLTMKRVTPDATGKATLQASLSGTRVGQRTVTVTYKTGPSDVLTWSLQTPGEGVSRALGGIFGTTNLLRAKTSVKANAAVVLPFVGTYKLSLTHRPDPLGDPTRSITWSTQVLIK
jgi:methionine-rich copper-binding protein CopC